ncbi:TonB-dependent receptor [Algiphilus sp. W345]|uniref:TonB-dependent receptor n=1 Tax=Banduia mediterranea TaxID=3075609 RepID=A0ABU2WK86_9GAMM|nr:TonB-dependent receptor [Algiphilus sp. W345]MDT0497953.1 TonB-dependent receptor [Algiphilus sp. W345]
MQPEPKNRPSRPYAVLVGRAGAAILCASLCGIAYGQDGGGNESADSDSTALQDTLVTGSRIRQIDVEGQSPVISIDRQQIDNSGYGSLTELLRLLPEAGAGTFWAQGNDQDDTSPGGAGISLRGLGADATLVLLNGRRVAISPYAKGITTSFVDLNTIPLAAIERIEVLKDGASALYGSDAIAGVVNIILRDDFQGAELSASYGDTTASEDAHETRASMVWGGSPGGTSKSHATVVLDYYQRTPLMYADRSISSTLDHTSQGGTNQLSSIGAPGTYQLQDGSYVADPACPDDLLLSGFCKYDYIQWQAALGEAERGGGLVMYQYDFNERLTAFTELQAQRNTSQVVGAPSPSFLNVTVPASHPDNPYGQDVGLVYRFLESGPRTFDVDTTNLRVLQGLRGRFDRWDWELGAQYARSDSEQVGVAGMVNSELAQAAVSSGAFNPFGVPDNDPDVVNTFTVRTIRSGESTSKSVDGSISGTVGQLPYGPIGVAAGVEARWEAIDDTPDQQFQRGLIIGTEATEAHGERDVQSGYLELQIPVWMRTDLQLAVRYDDYSDFGSTVNPKAALRYQPLDNLTLRASWGTAFRAPSLSQIGLGATAESPILVDERRCALAGPDTGDYCDPSELPVQFTGNEDLDAEEAESWGAGVVWQVSDPLAVTVDYWRIEIDDRITTDTRQLLLQEAADPDSLPAGTVERAAPTPEELDLGLPGRITEIHDTLRNAAKQKTDGIDANVTYIKRSGYGNWRGTLAYTYLLSFDEQLRKGGETRDLQGGYEHPENRFTASLDWSLNQWGSTLTANYIDSFRDDEDAGDVAAANTVDSWLTFDLQVRYTTPWSDTIRLSAVNLLDEEPPFSAATFQGFVPTMHDLRGRFVTISYSKRFF